MKRPTIAVDFDGTIINDESYPGMGDFLPGAADALKNMVKWADVVIHTCRTSEWSVDGRMRRRHSEILDEVVAIRAKLLEIGLSDEIQVWAGLGKPAADVYIDNRAVGFRGDWTETMWEVQYQFIGFAEFEYGPGAKTVVDEPERHPSSAAFVNRVTGWVELHDRKQRDYEKREAIHNRHG